MPQGARAWFRGGVPKRGPSYRDALFEAPEYADAQARLRANLRRLREERAWTQAEAAERCGMKFQQLSQVESGRSNVTLVTLCRLARGLGVDVAALLAAQPLEPSLPIEQEPDP